MLWQKNRFHKNIILEFLSNSMFLLWIGRNYTYIILVTRFHVTINSTASFRVFTITGETSNVLAINALLHWLWKRGIWFVSQMLFSNMYNIFSLIWCLVLLWLITYFKKQWRMHMYGKLYSARFIWNMPITTLSDVIMTVFLIM